MNVTLTADQENAKNLIAQWFFNTDDKVFVLSGYAGTGKTFLASCFAGESLARGKTVIFITAFSFLERARKYHTCFGDERESILQPLIDCDVLIIDDLGSESILTSDSQLRSSKVTMAGIRPTNSGISPYLTISCG